MHVSQFEPGDLVRRSTYPRGTYSTVVKKKSKSRKYPEMTLTTKAPGEETSDTFTINATSGPDWDEADWAHVTNIWFDNPDDCPETLRPPVEIAEESPANEPDPDSPDGGDQPE